MKYLDKSIYTALLMISILCSSINSCKPEHTIPSNSIPTTQQVRIFPDYKDITIPANIAPLNFMIKNKGDQFIVAIEGNATKMITGANKDGKILFEMSDWQEILQKNKGKDLKITIYAHDNDQWLRYPSYSLNIANDPIDAFLSYRLIEPGFELYRQIGLYQRNLTNFDVQTIYENNRKYDYKDNHCINCHNYQNYSTRRMLFHVRAAHGGTILADNGKITKVNAKNDSILGSTVYPSWHPKRNWIVFSSNKTGQVFHLLDPEKVEVLDQASDLVFYDADKKVIKNILKTPYDMETFPCWNPKGNKIFYCVARIPGIEQVPDSSQVTFIIDNYKNIHYNIMSMTFDEKTQTFGSPQLEVDCAAMGKSASVPRISPDGRYMLFTLGDYGQFHIWHKSSDLYVKDLTNGQIRPLRKANSKDVDSYHTWSSNGKWIVFSSRRDDGSYTRPYIAYFDKNGKDYKAFMLPQADPESNLLLLKSYNVPELTKDAVPYSADQFKEVIYKQEGMSVTYGGRAH